MNEKIKLIEQTEDSVGELIPCGLAYLGISDFRLWARNVPRIRPITEVDLEWTLTALFVLVSKCAPSIDDKNSPAYALTCVRLKPRRVRRLVWLGWW